MLEKITDWLIERRLKQEHIDIDKIKEPNIKQFCRVLNTLRTNRIMVVTREDGIYIRMTGDESKGEAFSYDFAKVLTIEKDKK